MIDHYVKTLMNTAFTYSLFLDRDKRILYYSDSMLRLLEIPDGSKYIGMTLLDAYNAYNPSMQIGGVERRLSRIMSGEYEFSEDETVVWPNGEKHIYRITYRQVLNEQNEFDGLLIFAQDLTDMRLEEAKQRTDDLLRSTILPCLIWDENGDVVAYNAEAARMIGAKDDLSPDAFNRFVLSIQPEFQPDGRVTEDLRQEVIREAIEKGFSQVSVRLAKQDGTPLYFTINAARISWMFGYRLVIFFYDQSDIMMKEAEAKEAEERMRLMLDSNPLMCVVRDDHGNIIDCNQEALNILGVADKAEFCRNFYSYFPVLQPDGRRSTDRTAEILKILDREGSYYLERTFRTPDGELIPVESKIVRIPWKNTYYYLSFSRDLRDMKATEQKMIAIERMSMIDQLTEIANRRSFDQRLSEEWRRAIREKSPISFMMIDVDNFKIYNDTYGHQQGDVALRAVAAAMTATVKRPADFVARWGGEEFVVLLPATPVEGALMLAERIRENIENTTVLDHDEKPTRVTVSIGVCSHVPGQNDQVDEFVSKADSALYGAKKAGRNRVHQAY